MKHPRYILTAIIVLASVSAAQPRVVSIEELPLGTDRQWQAPRFSPSGNSVYYTSSGFEGIWKFSLQDRAVSQISDAPGAGFGFSISQDETRIAYRTTTTLPTQRRTHSVIVQDLRTGSISVIDSGRDLTAPTITDQAVRYSKAGESESSALQVAGNTAEVLGIEQLNIALQIGPDKKLLDPLGTGRYIWPSLSPDRKLLVAYQMEQGTFVSDLEGHVLAILGRRNAPSWSHNGRWIAYMDDRDDGHRILSSEIMLVSPDGLTTVVLTETPDRIEMNPSCSPTEKKIAFNTLDGRVFLLTYSE